MTLRIKAVSKSNSVNLHHNSKLRIVGVQKEDAGAK